MTSPATTFDDSLVPADKGGQFLGHPKGLQVLFFTEMWERFSYYGMRALLMLFMVAPVSSGGFGFSTMKAASIYGWYTALVYLACIPGGWVADRYIGQRKAIFTGGVLLCIGHALLAFVNESSFFVGLGFIIVGTGLLKANISAIVGGLYTKDDPRRDGGFSIFYMGINIGAMLSPLACGYLGQKVSWHWGFGLAGIGMGLGLIQFVLGSKHLGEVGTKPQMKDSGVQIPLGKHLAVDAVAFGLAYLGGGIVGGIYCFVVTHFMFMLFYQGFTTEEWKRVGAIGCFFAFAALFWGAFEQAGSSLNLFADQYTDNTFMGWSFPSSWYQSVNALLIIALAPAFSWLWGSLGKRNPSSPVKFAFGLLFVGLGFLVMAVAARFIGTPEAKSLVSPNWLMLCYLLHTIGELTLSPVGLSLMTKLSPPRVVGMMMGVWFLAASLGNKIGGMAAGYFDTFPLPSLFGIVFLTTAATALLALILTKPIRKLMGDVL
ncbi:MAG: peptide MFS transporter [Elusimicrobia bacterium]|nr:peptide MFS transporter [Elusimicrobiota bacterium]